MKEETRHSPLFSLPISIKELALPCTHDGPICTISPYHFPNILNLAHEVIVIELLPGPHFQRRRYVSILPVHLNFTNHHLAHFLYLLLNMGLHIFVYLASIHLEVSAFRVLIILVVLKMRSVLVRAVALSENAVQTTSTNNLLNSVCALVM